MDKIKFILTVKKILKLKILKIAIIIVILAASVFFLTLDDTKYNEDGDMSSTVYAASMYVRSVKFTEDGIKFIYKDVNTNKEEEKTSKEMAEIMWNEMIEAGSNVTVYLDSYEELQKLMNAEIITQYPRITNKEVDLNGTVEFERHKSDGTSTMLQYISLEQFNNLLQNKDTNIINYFTLDENCNALVGVINESEQILTSNDPNMDLSDYADIFVDVDQNNTGNYSKKEYNISVKNIDYKSVISKYTMPFQYAWSFIVVGGDKGVGLELAELVDKSNIVVSIYDKVTTSINTTRCTYSRQNKVDLSATSTANYEGKVYRKSDSWNPANEWVEDGYQIELKNIYRDNIPILDVTKADVWMVDYSKEYTFQENQETSREINERDVDNLEYVSDSMNPRNSSNGTDLPYYDKLKNKLNRLIKDLENEVGNDASANITKCSANYYKRDINRHETDEFIQLSQNYVAKNPVNNPKIKKKTKQELEDGTGQDNFVTILSDFKHFEAKKRITFEASSWLFKALEQNPATQNMVELTKYLLNKVLEEERFKNNFSFDEFSNNNFYRSANIFGNNCEEKVWFALIAEGYSEYATAGLMGNIMQESRFKANNLQQKYEEILGMTDETYTEGVNSGTYTNFVHDSAGYGLAQWTFWSRKEALLAFSRDMGTGIDDEDMQINFLINEIKERGCPQWESATSVNDACYYFEKEFEQAGKPQMGNRLTYANDIYYRYKGRTAPTTIDVNLTGDNKTKMEALLQEAQRIANDDRYTYSQTNRYGEFQYDCSSLVYRLYSQFFGISVPVNTYGYGNEYRVGSTMGVELQPGDVLWRAGHVTLYIGNGMYVAAHTDSKPPKDQITVYNDYPNKYTYVYRFITN